MTDVGNTASQVSPIIKESEVDMFRDFMNRLANTVVQASDFAKQVSDLRTELNHIREDAAAVRKRNSELDEELAYVREQRNKAQDDARTAQEKIIDLDLVLKATDAQKVSAQAETERLAKEADTLRRDRDEAQFKVLELTEAKEKAEAILNDLRSRLGIPVPPVELPPLPKQEPVPVSQPEPLAPPTPYPADPTPAPTEPTPVMPAEERVYLKDVGPSEFWDAVAAHSDGLYDRDYDKHDYYYIKPSV